MTPDEAERDRRPQVELAENLISYARRYPWASYDPGDEVEEGTWRIWNLGFVRGAAVLLRSVLVLVMNDLGREAQLPLRSLMELAGNQYYMGKDKRRAVEFAASQAIEQQKLIRAGRRYNIVKDDDALEIVLRTAEERDIVRGYVGATRDEALEGDSRPMGAKASIRMAAAGLDRPAFEVAYDLASNLIHMNARALAVYVEGDPPESGAGAGTLALANELMLRVLRKADEALEQGQHEVIEAYAIEHKSHMEQPRSV